MAPTPRLAPRTEVYRTVRAGASQHSCMQATIKATKDVVRRRGMGRRTSCTHFPNHLSDLEITARMPHIIPMLWLLVATVDRLADSIDQRGVH